MLNDEVLKKALAQTGTDSLPAAIREAGFGAIDSAASAVLGAFSDQDADGPMGELPEMTGTQFKRRKISLSFGLRFPAISGHFSRKNSSRIFFC